MKLIKLLGSLGFALCLIAGLALILSVSTVLESLHGTPFAQENFYRAHWFDFFLGLVWLNIFCATLTRWPFKKKHVGFVITHIGILTLLLGSLGTRLYGSEGQMTLFEDQAKDRMLGSGFSLRVWLPGGIEKDFDLKAAPLKKPAKLPLGEAPFEIDLVRVMPHAELSHTLEEDASAPPNRAIQAEIASEMLGFKQDFVLVEEDPSDPHASSRTIGPATFLLETGSGPAPALLRLTQPSTGKTFSLPLRQDKISAEWKEAGLTLSNVRYLPQARVENSRLVNLPGAAHPNPAVEFEVSDASGRLEHHTRFSFFPEFDSLRGGAKSDRFGLEVDLEPPADSGTQAGPSFRFRVSQDGTWTYRVHSTRSGASEEQPLPLNEPVRTGWMDMTVTAKRTFAHARAVNEVREDHSQRSGRPAVELRIRGGGLPERTERLLLGRSLSVGAGPENLRVGAEPKSEPLPFSLGLVDFRKIDYPGTSNPAAFESDVVLRDAESGLTLARTISMNKPLEHKGWRVFQSSYILDERLGEASVFTIAKNPGMPAIYAGAVLIFLGVVLLFYFHPFFTGRNLAVALLAAGCLFAPAAAQAADADPMRSVPVQHNGRVKPFDAFARQTLKLVAGKEDLQKKDPTEFMAGLLAEPSKIADVEWIRAEFGPLLETLGLDREKHFFSLNGLLPARGKLEELVQSAKDKRDRDLRPTKTEQKAEELFAKVRTVEALIAGENYTKLPPGGVPRTRLELELLYHKLKPFEQAALLYFLSFLAFTLLKKGAGSRTGLWLALAAFAFHTLGLASRVYILSRPPVSNMYESMIFMNWALVAFALGFRARGASDTVLSAGAAVSGFVMLYANLLPIDPSLDVVVAVLRSSYWLTVHVLTIVSSYGAFGLAMGLGHRHLFLAGTGRLSKKAEQDSARTIFRVIQLGTLLIGTGTFLGGVWANESWGRFWGWDPKETWALITFLGYLLVVHLKYAKKLSDFFMAFSAVLGFQLVLMTWYGVNFVLGRGLHSYGSGSGGMRWVVYFLLFEAVFLGWALLRRFAK